MFFSKIKNTNAYKLWLSLLEVLLQYPGTSLRFFVENIFLGSLQIISIGSLYPIIFVVMNNDTGGNNVYIKFFNKILAFAGLQNSLGNYLILAIFIASMSLILSMLIDFDQTSFLRKLEYKLRMSFAGVVINSKWEVLRELNHGEFINALNREAELYKQLVKYDFMMVCSFIQLVMFGSYLFLFNLKFGIISFIMLSGGFLIFVPLMRVSHKFGQQYTEAFARQTDCLVNATRAFKNIKTGSLENFFLKYLEPYVYKLSALYFKNQLFSSVQSKFTEFTGFVILCALLFINIQVIKTDIPALILSLVILYRIIPEVRSFTDNMNRAYNGLPSLSEIKKLQAKCIPDEEGCKTIDKSISNIEFENVTFGYGTSAVPLFRDLNVCFKKGEFWAIAGPTGSGKTTILDLISGVLRPTVGKIVFDNIPLDEAKLSSLHQHIGYLTQNNFIFAGSILANISWGHEKELDSVKIENVVKISQMSDILKEKTLDFKVSESGQNLSGGQQQRIAITRTLLKDYDFILMDEPSSALDNETEKNFLEALSSLKGKIGIIMVTHRKEYFKHADYILEINGGCVEILSGKRE